MMKRTDWIEFLLIVAVACSLLLWVYLYILAIEVSFKP